MGRLDPSRAMTILKRGLRLVCPRCGKGRLYHTLFSMVPECPECGLPCEPEMGYCVGAIYINYGLTTLIALAGYFILDVYTSISLNWQLLLWAGFCVLFPVFFLRYSKSLWLSFDFIFNRPSSGRRGTRPGPG